MNKNTARITASLPAELKEIQARWEKELNRKEQSRIYAEEFGPQFAPLFAKLPLHKAPKELEKPRALISLLGFSWEPVALMAAWAKPEEMLIIGTKESLRIEINGEDVVSIVSQVSKVPRSNIRRKEILGDGESEIYKAVKEFVADSDFDPQKIYVDPTGGKKTMSASASLSAFLTGTPIVYVDYSSYSKERRIPLAGTEFPRLLANPLEVLGHLDLEHIFVALDRSDFDEAARLARNLEKRLYDGREAECLTMLAQGYGAWDNFKFQDAIKSLEEARAHLEMYGEEGKWSWAPRVFESLESGIAFLGNLNKIKEAQAVEAIEEAAPLLAWYLTRARRMLESPKTSLCVLLCYAAMERFTDLCLLTIFGLDDKAPDYSLIQNVLDEKTYIEMGKILHGKKYYHRKLEGPLMYSNGIQLLAALPGDQLRKDDLGPLRGLAAARNSCEYEHGLIPKIPSADEAKRFLNGVSKILCRELDGEGQFTNLMNQCRFPTFTR